jgi:hypothetical protein
MGHRDRLRDGPGFGDDLESLASIEQRDESLANDLVVVDDEQAQPADWSGFGHWFLRAGAVTGSGYRVVAIAVHRIMIGQ